MRILWYWHQKIIQRVLCEKPEIKHGARSFVKLDMFKRGVPLYSDSENDDGFSDTYTRFGWQGLAGYGKVCS